MRGVIRLTAVVLAAAAIGPAPAQAERGTGLYAPFPSASGGARAERFAGELGVDASAAALRRGVALDGLRRSAHAPAPAAATRSGAAGGRSTTALLAGAALALLVGGAAALVAAHRRTSV